MAKASALRANSVVVQYETAPGTFATICGITKRKFSLKKSLTDIKIPDCTDLELAAWVERVADSLSGSFALGGVAASESLPGLLTVTKSSESVTTRLRLVGLGTGGGTPDLQVSGKYHFSEISIQSDVGGLAEVDLTLESDGELTVASVAALP